VLWALEVLRVPSGFYGVLLAGLAVGGVLGSLVADRLGRALGTGRSFAVALWGSVAAYAGLGLTSDGAVAFALLAVLGATGMLWNVLSASFRQAVVPSRLMGRVNSVYRGATWGVIPVGAALGGVTADRLGLRAPFLLAAAVLVVATVVALPHLRSARLEAARRGGGGIGRPDELCKGTAGFRAKAAVGAAMHGRVTVCKPIRGRGAIFSPERGTR
jgi:MFS family permease